MTFVPNQTKTDGGAYERSIMRRGIVKGVLKKPTKEILRLTAPGI